MEYDTLNRGVEYQILLQSHKFATNFNLRAQSAVLRRNNRCKHRALFKSFKKY